MKSSQNKPLTLEEVLEIENNAKNYEGKDKIISSAEAQKYIDSLPDNPVRYKTGFEYFDSLIERIEGGEMLIVSGETKSGKTTWCQAVTKNLSDKGINSLWFSYEMPVRQLLSKFPKDTMFYLPKTLYDKDLKWIEYKIYEAKLKYGVNVVFIDHLHFIIDLMARTPSWEVGRVVREVKKIAVKHNVIIFLICHLKKTKLDVNETPSIDDLRDSSFIAQDSDGVFFLTRKAVKDFDGTEYLDESILSVAVHRHSGAREKKVDLIYFNKMLYEKHRESSSGFQKIRENVQSKKTSKTFWD